ncbi:MAG: hypothetical protein BMS9Abin37_1294 [Acidobacteriota bacterium]|nr:MAG: hypothetical protein BMS9Abin37_1294 [Acidobacteriota bacterium]
MLRIIVAALVVSWSLPLAARDAGILDARIQELVDKYQAATLEFRHHVHEHPELSNREHETAKLVAEHLRSVSKSGPTSPTPASSEFSSAGNPVL